MRRRPLLLLVLATVAALGTGCSGNGPSRAAATAAATTPTPHGGLVGTIDRARLLAVCENIRGASTVVDTGMSAGEADRFLTGAADLLQKPPVDAEAAALGARISADVTAHREQAAVGAGQAFCAKRGG